MDGLAEDVYQAAKGEGHPPPGWTRLSEHPELVTGYVHALPARRLESLHPRRVGFSREIPPASYTCMLARDKESDVTNTLRWMWLGTLALLLVGCNMSSPGAATDSSGAAPSAQSKWFNPANKFKNPQALALARAAQDNNAAEVRRLMKDEHVDPDKLFSDDGHSIPLIAWPVITQSLGGLKAMLDNGADPNARNPETHTGSDPDSITFYRYDSALVFAAKTEDPAYLKLLLEHGGDPNTRNMDHESLLFQAFIWHNQWPNVQVLVEHGADVKAITQGDSILTDYTERGDFKKAYWLLQHGADPKAQGKGAPGIKPRYLAVDDIFWYPSKPGFIDDQRQCQQWLLTRGIKRSPMPDYYRDMRKRLGAPYEEKNIPLL